MLKSKLLATAIIMGVASAAAAQSDEKDAPKVEKEKKICRTERATGSLTRVNRTCLTQAQWDELAQRANSSISRMSDASARTDRVGGAGGPYGNGPQ